MRGRKGAVFEAKEVSVESPKGEETRRTRDLRWACSPGQILLFLHVRGQVGRGNKTQEGEGLRAGGRTSAGSTEQR